MLLDMAIGPTIARGSVCNYHSVCGYTQSVVVNVVVDELLDEISE